jgi:hypothetical protein
MSDREDHEYRNDLLNQARKLSARLRSGWLQVPPQHIAAGIVDHLISELENSPIKKDLFFALRMSATPERVDRASLIAEAKAWLADPCDEGCGDCGQEATSLISLLIAALEVADEKYAALEMGAQLAVQTHREHFAKLAAEDKAISAVVREPNGQETHRIGLAALRRADEVGSAWARVGTDALSAILKAAKERTDA